MPFYGREGLIINVFYKEKNFNYEFTHLWLCRIFIAVWALLLSEWGLLHCGVKASHCSDFFSCGAQALGHMGSAVVAHRL